MAANRLQYPCNGCGVLGHWKRDGECNPKDVAAYIKKKMEEQSKRDTEEDDDNESGTKYIFLDSSTKFDVNTEFLIF
jgi:poly(3-hydroxybutyrate) depolymerase